MSNTTNSEIPVAGFDILMGGSVTKVGEGVISQEIFGEKLPA